MATASRRPVKRPAQKKRFGFTTNVARAVRAVTIRRPAEDLYGFWRQFENLAQVVQSPVLVTSRSPTESHWAVAAPGGKKIEWDAEVTDDRPNELIAWRSRPGADVPNSGVVRFTPAPGGDATEVTVEIEYALPGGKLGALLAKLTGKEAGQQVSEALRRFKALMEAGEIPTIASQPTGGPQAPRKGKK
jgi:uncharacterized membrane protein